MSAIAAHVWAHLALLPARSDSGDPRTLVFCVEGATWPWASPRGGSTSSCSTRRRGARVRRPRAARDAPTKGPRCVYGARGAGEGRRAGDRRADGARPEETPRRHTVLRAPQPRRVTQRTGAAAVSGWQRHCSACPARVVARKARDAVAEPRRCPRRRWRLKCARASPVKTSRFGAEPHAHRLEATALASFALPFQVKVIVASEQAEDRPSARSRGRPSAARSGRPARRAAGRASGGPGPCPARPARGP